jgi:flagellar basal body-associated protein FliL
MDVSMSRKSIAVFFCYAHEDEEFLNKLKAHLSPLQQQGLITVWHDRDISAGVVWEEEIKRHLNEAQVILLLISPDFMNSRYCYSFEMQHALERQENGEATVIPVILRPTYWQVKPLDALQALPPDGKPGTSHMWDSQDEAFVKIVLGVRNAVEARIAREEQLRKAEEVKQIRLAKEAEKARLAEEKRRQSAEQAEEARIAREEQLRKSQLRVVRFRSGGRILVIILAAVLALATSIGVTFSVLSKQTQLQIDATATILAHSTQTAAIATTTAQAKQPAPAPSSSFANIVGNYSGTMSNAGNLSAKMTLIIQQNQSTIRGELTEYPPLAPGNGPITGTTGADLNGDVFIQFSWSATIQYGECGNVCTFEFRGYLYTDGSLGGTYTIEQDHESGNWTVAK